MASTDHAAEVQQPAEDVVPVVRHQHVMLAAWLPGLLLHQLTLWLAGAAEHQGTHSATPQANLRHVCWKLGGEAADE